MKNPNSGLFFFFFCFLYHAFIVPRYKKLRAALAMEETKPINQNNNKRNPISLVPPLPRRAGKRFAETLQTSTNNGLQVKISTKFSYRKYKEK